MSTFSSPLPTLLLLGNNQIKELDEKCLQGELSFFVKNRVIGWMIQNCRLCESYTPISSIFFFGEVKKEAKVGTNSPNTLLFSVLLRAELKISLELSIGFLPSKTDPELLVPRRQLEQLCGFFLSPLHFLLRT